MRHAALALLACIGLLAQSPAPQKPLDLDTLGAQAFRAGYTLTAMAGWRDRYLKAGGAMNHFQHQREILSAFAEELYPSEDTLGSTAWVELANGPVTLNVPATGSRYLMLQFVSAWAETFAIIGRKQLDGRAATLLLTPPGWTGTMPGGARRIPCPTSIVAVSLRLFVAGEGDVAAVRNLQDRFVFSNSPPPPRLPDSYFDALGKLLPANPPPQLLSSVFERLTPLGLSLDRGVDPAALDTESRRALDAAIALSRKDIPRPTRQARRVDGGWVVLDAGPPIPSTLEERIARAHSGPEVFAAMPRSEALYAVGYADSNGEQLRGDRRYVVTFDPASLPPVDGFWSFTVYTAGGRPVFGARHSIRSSASYLNRTASGAIRITLGPSLPLAEQYNWLPVQPGEGVRVMLRLYQPRRAALDGSWRPPAIVPAGQAGP